jgi:hypothetical protein
MPHHPRTVFIANGEIHAQQIRAFLEAAGISGELRGRARALLASAESGEFRLDDDADTMSS